MANLRIESAIRVSVSLKCVMGVGGMVEMSRGSGDAGDAGCRDLELLVRGRRLADD